MKKYLPTLLLALAIAFQPAQAQSGASLSGTVFDENYQDVVPLATILLKKDDDIVTGTSADFDGYYQFSNVPPDTYTLEARAFGLPTFRITGLQLKAGQNRQYNINLPLDGTAITTQETVYEGTLSGIVFDTKLNQPIPNALVILRVYDPETLDYITLQTQTNANGEYFLEGILRIGDLNSYLRVEHKDYPVASVQQPASRHFANNIWNFYYPETNR